LYLGVIGASSCDEEERRLAESVGRVAATRHFVIVCGGRGGVMEAAAKGAREAGGLVVGILPDADRGSANPYLTVSLPTGMGEARNALIVRSCDAVVAVGGAYGTLSEIALALKMGVPVVGVNTWVIRQPRLGLGPIQTAGDPEKAVALAAELAGLRGGSR